ncbi:MAG: hypothetical protein L0Z73_03235 [Gammaproteobacteria bacterium]|nr:hypothetical protein [Gammaproteobacteria bacterium]
MENSQATTVAKAIQLTAKTEKLKIVLRADARRPAREQHRAGQQQQESYNFRWM